MVENKSSEITPKISREDVAKVAGLGMLSFEDAQLDAFTVQLQSILDLADSFDSFDLDSLPPTAHPFGLENIYRSDEVEEVEGIREAALAAAPEVESDQFKVPPALGEEL